MDILRTSSSFEQVLDRQLRIGRMEEPSADEADHLFVIRELNNVGHVLDKVINTIQN